jgi:hypothetical protein
LKFTAAHHHTRCAETQCQAADTWQDTPCQQARPSIFTNTHACQRDQPTTPYALSCSGPQSCGQCGDPTTSYALLCCRATVVRPIAQQHANVASQLCRTPYALFARGHELDHSRAANCTTAWHTSTTDGHYLPTTLCRASTRALAGVPKLNAMHARSYTV